MALSDLVKSCQAYFIDQNINVPIEMGEKPIFKNHQSNKVIFTPIGGKYGPARGQGHNPRHLRTWISTAEVHCLGYDGYGASKGFPAQDELQHYEQTEIIHNQIQRAIYHYAHGMRYELSSPKWTNSPTDKKYGKELVFTVELEVPIIDEDQLIAPTPMSYMHDGYMVFPSGYQFSPPIPGGFVGLVDLNGVSTVDGYVEDSAC